MFELEDEWNRVFNNIESKPQGGISTDARKDSPKMDKANGVSMFPHCFVSFVAA